MKIGVSTYSFQRWLEDGGSDLPAVVRKAREMGFQGIELTKGSFPVGEVDLVAYGRRIRDACARERLPIISYVVGADFLRPEDGGDWRDQVERLKDDVRIAAALGAPCMRHDATRGWDAGFDDALPILARGCRAVAEFAQDHGVRTMVENHGFFVQESSRCARLMEAVKHANFGSLVDIGNFLCADDDPVEAVTRMAPYAVHCHAKDFHRKPKSAPDPGRGWFRSRAGAHLRGAIIGHGVVDVPGCIRALKRAGYAGFISIEFEGLEDTQLGLESGLENLRGYLGREGCLGE